MSLYDQGVGRTLNEVIYPSSYVFLNLFGLSNDLQGLSSTFDCPTAQTAPVRVYHIPSLNTNAWSRFN